MFLHAHPWRSRHGVYDFRIVLPDSLQAVFGKREYIRSLGTKCPRQARLAAGLLVCFPVKGDSLKMKASTSWTSRAS